MTIATALVRARIVASGMVSLRTVGLPKFPLGLLARRRAPNVLPSWVRQNGLPKALLGGDLERLPRPAPPGSVAVAAIATLRTKRPIVWSAFDDLAKGYCPPRLFSGSGRCGQVAVDQLAGHEDLVTA